MRTSASTVVISGVGVKDWLADLPPPDAVRPARCPHCGAAARPHGEPLGLWGHGLRDRLCVGPVDFGEPAERLIVRVRRYLCRQCGKTCTVLPRGICPGRRYLIGAIVWALALWALSDAALPAADVRRRISPYTLPSQMPPWRGWAQLGRWAQADELMPIGSLPDGLAPRACAERLAQMYAGRSPPSTRHLDLCERAHLGAYRYPG